VSILLLRTRVGGSLKIFQNPTPPQELGANVNEIKNLGVMNINNKSQIPNNKQYQNSNDQNPKEEAS
jgi:hypothetical protein